MPERAVVADALLVCFDAVGLEQLALVSLSKVPVETQRRDGQVRPSVTHGQVTEINVARPLAGRSR